MANEILYSGLGDQRLTEILAGTLSYHGAAREMLSLHGQPDLLLIYYQAIDQVSPAPGRNPPGADDSPPASLAGVPV